jgi:steroid delta-isomerase-like uncharacterized protein
MNRRSVLAAAAFAASMLLAPLAHASDAAGEIVKAYVAAWNAHDIEKAVSWFTDDVIYFDASVGTAVEGKANATAKVVASFINAAPDCKWEMLGEPIVDGDMVAFQWRFTGTNTGAWADGTEAANKPFNFIGATVISIKNGKIHTQSDYYDALGFYKQLGWM